MLKVCMMVLDYYSFSFNCSYHFQWPWPYFKVTAMSNSFNWYFMFFPISWNFVTVVRNIHHYFSFLCETLMLAFFAEEVFQTLCDYDLAWGLLLIHTWFNGLDLFQGYRYVWIINCKLYFRFLSTSDSAWLLLTLKWSSTVYFVWLVCH